MTSLDHLEEPGGLAGERMANRKGLGYRELVKIKCKGYQGHTLIKLVNSIGICNAIMIEVHFILHRLNSARLLGSLSSPGSEKVHWELC